MNWIVKIYVCTNQAIEINLIMVVKIPVQHYQTQDYNTEMLTIRHSI